MCFHGGKLNFPQQQTYFSYEDDIRWQVKEVSQGDCRER